jgi:sterol desaturase/sphingolipid hydroxylase (fatty acid hydroxylase superfamily)
MPDKLKLNELEKQKQMNRNLFNVVLSFILNMSKTRAKHWSSHHLIHHRHTDANFGVTTPVWDVLLGMRYAYDRKR